LKTAASRFDAPSRSILRGRDRNRRGAAQNSGIEGAAAQAVDGDHVADTDPLLAGETPRRLRVRRSA
jgi:hypothetical protein